MDLSRVFTQRIILVGVVVHHRNGMTGVESACVSVDIKSKLSCGFTDITEQKCGSSSD
jgi:hypothetical protein